MPDKAEDKKPKTHRVFYIQGALKQTFNYVVHAMHEAAAEETVGADGQLIAQIKKLRELSIRFNNGIGVSYNNDYVFAKTQQFIAAIAGKMGVISEVYDHDTLKNHLQRMCQDRDYKAERVYAVVDTFLKAGLKFDWDYIKESLGERAAVVEERCKRLIEESQEPLYKKLSGKTQFGAESAVKEHIRLHPTQPLNEILEQIHSGCDASIEDVTIAYAKKVHAKHSIIVSSEREPFGADLASKAVDVVQSKNGIPTPIALIGSIPLFNPFSSRFASVLDEKMEDAAMLKGVNRANKAVDHKGAMEKSWVDRLGFGDSSSKATSSGVPARD